MAAAQLSTKLSTSSMRGNKNIPAWQQIYHQLNLNNFKNVTSYEVNGNLFIVVPLEEK